MPEHQQTQIGMVGLCPMGANLVRRCTMGVKQNQSEYLDTRMR